MIQPPGLLHVHRATRFDALLPELAGWLAAAPGDPFAPDVLAVPTRGVERYLAQQLAQRLGTSGAGDGVCAGVGFPSPAELFGSVIATMSGIEYADDPWRPDLLTWSILEVIDASLNDPWASALRSHIRGSDGQGRPGRRWALARRLARLFDRYGQERPELVRDWRAGHDTDGAGRPIPTELGWQPVLWRLVAAHLPVPAPAERTPDVLRVLADDPDRVDLPARLGIVGATRLPTQQLDLARVLAVHRDVHLWLPDPSPTRWRAIADSRPIAPPVPRRRNSPVPTLTAAPLLRSLGRDSGELAWRLLAGGVESSVVEVPRPDTLLGRVQAYVSGSGPTDPATVPVDTSLQIHGCHGRARQVEVLRETILSLLHADQTLEPRDVVVMCPDLATFAPLVSAAFESMTVLGDRTVDLRVRVADRPATQDNAVLTALARILDLADGRPTRSAVLDLAALPAVRARFGFDDAALERFDELAEQTAVRWGLDPNDRERFEVPLWQSTWADGLDRILLGAALSADGGMLADTLPAAGVVGTDLDAIGRFAEFIDRLRLTFPELREPRRLTEWGQLLNDIIPALFDATGPDAWQLPAALGMLARWVERAGTHDPELDLGDVRVWLAERRAGRPTRTHFRTGGLTVCAMAPMRAVPYRVICLLGLDDGVFPRPGGADGDDVTRHNPLIGERDHSAEDRQQFLDALMAATDSLVITYASRDVRTNAAQPPAVPVGELMDTLADVTGRDADSFVTHHPLQPFDPLNFAPDTPVNHDPADLAGAVALSRSSGPPRPFILGPLPDPEPGREVSVEELVRFLGNPADFLLRDRLGLPSSRTSEALGEQLPVEPDPLARWSIGDRILAGLIRGEDRLSLCRAEVARGELPPYGLGRAAYHAIEEPALVIADHVSRFAVGRAREVPVTVTLPSGHVLTGMVGGLYDEYLVTASYSKLKAKALLGSWVRQLILAAAGTPVRGVVVARSADKKADEPVTVWLSDPVSGSALDELDRLVTLLHDNLVEPVPFLPETARTYVTHRRKKDAAEALARTAASWNPAALGSEAADVAVGRVWGDFAGLTAQGCDADDPADPGGTTRFGVLAQQIWTPVLAHGRTVSGGASS